MPRAGDNIADFEAAVLKYLSLINWSLLTLSVLASLIGAAACLLMWPFPQMAGDGARLADIWIATALSLLVAVTAGLSTWLVDKRHSMLWLGQGLLVVVVAAALIYGLVLR